MPMAIKRYELRVAGCWSERTLRAFPDMEVASVDPQTMICGEVRDQKQLHRLLALCQSLGLQIRSLSSRPIDQEPDAERPSSVEQAQTTPT
jgi:hypothetical protein